MIIEIIYDWNMQALNYHHLFYFWRVARLGGVGAAARELRLTQPTLSKQIRGLEQSLGRKLFEKQGRGLALTDEGRLALGYAEEIFALGGELSSVFGGAAPRAAPPLRIGLADAVPKLVAWSLLRRVAAGDDPHAVSCEEGNGPDLLRELTAFRLDAVISDHPAGPGPHGALYSRRVAESRVGLFASGPLHRRLRRGFPRCLHGAPALLPMPASALRRSLDGWFHQHAITPRLVAECEDSALLKMLGRDGLGFFPAPVSVADDLRRLYDARLVGEAGGLTEGVYVLTVERRSQHPALGRLLRPVDLAAPARGRAVRA